jgi:cytochrome d ubiquinol oxidase subunit II
MNASWESIAVAVSLFATMAAYALFAGADFGGGIWDLLAGRTATGEKPRDAIDRSVTPVWEGNQVWIVLGFVLVFTGYPSTFAAVMTALFVPLSLSLLGIVLRGIGFGFRHETERLVTTQLAGVLFAASSVLAPFFLGVSVGAVATGRVTTHPAGNVPAAWLSPTALVTGVLFVAACAYIAGVYLVGDSHQRGDEEMVRYFSRRTIAAGVVTGVVAAVNLLLLRVDATYVFHRLVTVALPLVVVSVVAGAAALALVLLRRIWFLRVSAAVAVIAVVAAWGVAQYPYLLPSSLTLAQGSAPVTSLRAELVVMVLAALLVAPAFAYLYWLQQHGRLEVTESSEELAAAAVSEQRSDGPGHEETRGHPVVVTVVLGAAAVELAREAVSRLRRRQRSRAS